MKKMRVAGYKISFKLINTADHGVCQRRWRAYGVAVLKSKMVRPFSWPKAVPLKYTLGDLVNGSPSESAHMKFPTMLTPKGRKRVRALVKRALMKAVPQADSARQAWTLVKADAARYPLFMDIDCSVGRDNMAYSKTDSVCYPLTESRGRSGGPYLLTHGRRTTMREMSWLQGLDLTDAEVSVIEEQSLTVRQFGSFMGNGTSNNVMERILARGLVAAGLVSPGSVVDRWGDPAIAIGPMS